MQNVHFRLTYIAQKRLCLSSLFLIIGSSLHKNDTQIRGSPIGFFNPVIPTKDFVQYRNSEGYFWHPTSRVYFQSRISPRFCFQIPNPELQIKEIPDPQKPIGDPQINPPVVNCSFEVYIFFGPYPFCPYMGM